MICRAIPVIGALAGALLLSATALASEAPRYRSVSVSGQGEVRAEPDKATVNLGVQARRPQLNDARTEVTRTVEAVLKLTRELKIDQKYVHATRIAVQPEYNWDANGRERSLIGYFVSRQVEVELRDLDKLGQLLEKAADLGINQVSDPQLDSSKRKEYERQALAKAVEDARLNADTIARAAGGALGATRTISANSSYVPVPVPMRMKSMAVTAEANDASQSYQSGEMVFNATVQVEFDLKVAGAEP